MSKLFKSYVALKVKDCSKFYLFKSGIFYIFLDDDARTMAPLLNLKLGNLTPTVVKCGFPISSLDKYLERLRGTEYCIHIVCDEDFDCSVDANYFANNKALQNILYGFLATDINELSISQAFDLLIDLQKKLKKFKLEESNEKKRLSI
ncbi:MAG: hypothetical protein ACI4VQ_00995 [Clostridia bacterium]